MIFDNAGNLYGTLTWGGGYGAVFELVRIGGVWAKKTLYSFSGWDGSKLHGGLVFDAAGNLYGTTSAGGPYGGGTVFMLSPSGNGWTFTRLYSFTGSARDSFPDIPGPNDSLVIDAAGSLYGTTYAAGAYGYGNVFKLTPSNGGWTYTSLHDFNDWRFGAHPYGGVVLDTNGNLYGTTDEGGTACGDNGCGVVWEITP